MIVTLEEVKTHLRLDHTGDDADLLLYIAAAEDRVANFLNRSLVSWGEHGSPIGSPSIQVPEAVRHAIKMIVGNLYENREECVVGQTININPTTEALLFPYRASLGV